ncbi:DUF6691 family protein [Pontibacter harenae]|uniref:DUF6691 family protein n=1 Tax=Pontibacter harenae TaxID=2894083 RepID=UPI001E33A95D|nr:DUF6691 family protein [Pontibacter harenae]MCC9169003.1 YeeE/YedE family protein [Pontibacter harenae]
MKYLTYLSIGTLFGIIMTKSQAISWYRIYEMFRFDSFHMYGIIGSAVTLGVISVYLIKKFKLRTSAGDPIAFTPKNKSIPRYLYGGIIFGLGWALTGACPGPMYTLIGGGFSVILVVLFSAILGTLAYGMLRKRLPH